MAGELQLSFVNPTASVACLIRSSVSGGMVWAADSGQFIDYATSRYSGCLIPMSGQGIASAYFVGNMPQQIAPGVYNVDVRQNISFAETDPSIGGGEIEWMGLSGSRQVASLTSMITSGVFSLVAPFQTPRGQMIRNFPLYFKSPLDGVSPFTSGVVSGRVANDSGLFRPIDSGAFTEVGNGFYRLQALTSNDLNGSVVRLLFTARNVSGGDAVPLPMMIVTQQV